MRVSGRWLCTAASTWLPLREMQAMNNGEHLYSVGVVYTLVVTASPLLLLFFVGKYGGANGETFESGSDDEL